MKYSKVIGATPAKSVLAMMVLAALLSACASTQTTETAGQPQSQRSTTMSKKETVGAFLGAVLKSDAATMHLLANADYIQHNPHIPTGLEPFIQLLPVLQAAKTTAENMPAVYRCPFFRVAGKFS